MFVKNARRRAFYEFGNPMLTESQHVWPALLTVMSEAEHGSFESKDDDNMLAG